MQEARPESETRGNRLAVANAFTDLLQHAFVHFVHLDKRQEREIVPLVESVEMRPELPGERWCAVHSACEHGRILLVGEQLYTLLREDRRLTGQGSAPLIGVRQLAGRDLAGFHVRLDRRPRIETATAVANSQRKNSSPRSQGSSTAIRTTG
jgi:hypothetical protein